MLGKNNRENMCAEKHSNVGSNMLDNCMERNFLSRNESIQFFEKMKLNRSSWKWLRVSFSYIGIHPDQTFNMLQPQNPLNLLKFANRRIWRLLKCEMFGQDEQDWFSLELCFVICPISAVNSCKHTTLTLPSSLYFLVPGTSLIDVPSSKKFVDHRIKRL